MSIQTNRSDEEVLLLHSYAQDIVLFHDPSADKYRLMAALIMGVGYMDVTDNQRQATKEMVFKLLYGGFEEKSTDLQKKLSGTVSGRMMVTNPPLTYYSRD